MDMERKESDGSQLQVQYKNDTIECEVYTSHSINLIERRKEMNDKFYGVTSPEEGNIDSIRINNGILESAGNTTIGTNIGNCLTQLIVDDYFMNNIIHCNIAADLCGYSQLYKHTAGSPQITEYGGFTITPSQFESDGRAKAWVANKINPDGTISTFAIV